MTHQDTGRVPGPEPGGTGPGTDRHGARDAEVIPFPGPGRSAEVQADIVDAELIHDDPHAEAPGTPGTAPGTGMVLRPRPGDIIRRRAAELAPACRVVIVRAAYPAAHPARTTAALARHSYHGAKGLARGTAVWWRWVTAEEYAPHLATKPDLVEAVRKRRWIVTGAGTVTASAGVAAAGAVWAPGPWLIILAVVFVAGAVERHRAGVETSEAGRAALGPKPGSKAIRKACSAAKLGKADDIRVIGPVVRTDAAWEATVELPPGTTYRHATRRRGELAGAIGVDEVQVALDPVRGHNGRVRVWCADEDPMQGERVESPLLSRTAPVDFWKEKVFAGRDARGRPVEFSLVERSYLIGGEPGGGKSVASNNLLAFMAMAPRVRMFLADGKFGFDLAPWEPMAEAVLTEQGHTPMMDLIESLRAEMSRRYALLRKVGSPKVTADIAKRYDLDPVLFHIDEVQTWSASGVSKEEREFIVGVSDLVGRGRAAGFITGVVTQRPAAEVVPTRLRDILSIRHALRCTTPDASDTILGSGRASQGYSAALFNADQRGAGFLLAEGAQPVQMRSAFLDSDRGEVSGIARRAYALREEAGTLPASADRPEVRLLSAVLEAMGDAHKGAHTAELLEALGRVSAEFAGWDAARLAAALKPVGVAPVQLDIGGRNRNGYRRTDVQAALERV